jgi:hypothetical protein
LATASYRELFAEPALRRLALADVCARLPQGMVSIALLASALWRGPAGLVIGTAVLAGLLNPPLSPGLDQLDHERRRGGRCRRGQRRHHLHPAAAPPAENPAGHARDRGSHPGSFG